MPPKGQHLSLEAREKIRIARLGTHHTEEWRINHSKQMSGSNHHMYGKHWSEEIKEKIRKSLTGIHQSDKSRQKRREVSFGQNNNHWKGDDVGNKGLHQWLRKNLSVPDLCQICKLVPPQDLANISRTYNRETYTREVKNWQWLCKKCHSKHDKGKHDRKT